MIRLVVKLYILSKVSKFLSINAGHIYKHLKFQRKKKRCQHIKTPTILLSKNEKKASSTNFKKQCKCLIILKIALS